MKKDRTTRMNGEWGWMGITFSPIHPWSDEWGWMDRTRILFIPIHPHSSLFIPIHLTMGEWVKSSDCFYYIGNKSRNDVRLYFNWIIIPSKLFVEEIKASIFISLWMNGDEWGWMDRMRILFIPIHPHSSDHGWMGEKVIPIHPHSPFIQVVLCLLYSWYNITDTH